MLGARGAGLFSFGVLGGACGVFEDPLEVLGGFWWVLGMSWETLGCSWWILAGSWVVLAGPLALLGVLWTALRYAMRVLCSPYNQTKDDSLRNNILQITSIVIVVEWPSSVVWR